MKKQKASGQGKWMQPGSKNNSGMRKGNSRYPAPKDGIIMHIDELKEKLKAIQARFSVDPNLLPEIVHR